MKVTKYEHACMVLEDQGQKLIIDPGMFTKSLNDTDNVAGIVITDVHKDHFDPKKVEEILASNPSAQVFVFQEGAGQLIGQPVQVVSAGSLATAGPFKLSFFGGQHALIHQSIPQAKNLGVLVNQAFYYPGDSFTVPENIHVQVLALPTSGPWLKIGESMDFLATIKPKIAFPTHDGLQNEASAGMTHTIVGGLAKSLGVDYYPLAVGEELSF